MYDEEAGEPKWINATYERWFILVGIYGFATLRNKASGLWQAIIMRYGERLDTELAFKKSPDETGSLLRPFLHSWARKCLCGLPRFNNMNTCYDSMNKSYEHSPP
jgi:hypothetical protein